jgi:hypothetical protein
MIKALAWTTLAVSLLFVALALTALFGWNSLGEKTAWMLAWFGAVPLAGLAVCLAIAVMLTAFFSSDA